MKIDEFIDAVEEDYLEFALEKLARNPKDLIAIYLSALEYRRSKLMRSNHIPNDNENEKDITIIIKE